MNITAEIWIYLALLLSSVVNIVVPISGSATLTPLLALLTDPHRAIGLTSFYFVLSGIVRIFLFRKNIEWAEVKKLLLPSVVMALLGASALVVIPPRILLVVVFLLTVHFLIKKIWPKEKKGSNLTSYVVGLLSGFLQGAGLSGSDLRNSYFYSKQLNIAQVHGTSSFMGTSNFFIATIARLYTGQLTLPDLTLLIYLFPFIVIAILIGRHLLYKLPKKVSEWIIIIIMITIVTLLGVKILRTF